MGAATWRKGYRPFAETRLTPTANGNSTTCTGYLRDEDIAPSTLDSLYSFVG